jgi:hypothetical protein
VVAVVGGRTTSGEVGAEPTSSCAGGPATWALAAAVAGAGSRGTGTLTRICEGSTAGGVSGSNGGGSVGFRTWSSTDDESSGLAPSPGGEMVESELTVCERAIVAPETVKASAIATDNIERPSIESSLPYELPSNLMELGRP